MQRARRWPAATHFWNKAPSDRATAKQTVEVELLKARLSREHGTFLGAWWPTAVLTAGGLHLRHQAFVCGPWLPSHFTRARFFLLRRSNSESMPTGHVNAKLPCLFAPFPGENPRLLQTQRDSSLSSCLQTANQEQCLTVRNNYLASFALSTFQIQKGDKATVPVAQARSPSRRASSTAGSSLIPAETRGGARLAG